MRVCVYVFVFVCVHVHVFVFVRADVVQDAPMLRVLELTSEKVFVPLCIGGGIRDYTDSAVRPAPRAPSRRKSQTKADTL